MDYNIISLSNNLNLKIVRRWYFQWSWQTNLLNQKFKIIIKIILL